MPHWRARLRNDEIEPVNSDLIVADIVVRKAFFDGLILGAIGAIATMLAALLMLWVLRH